MEEKELQKIKNRKKQKNIIDIIDKGIKDRNRKKLLVDLINECDDRIH